jgi:bifunctional non-homologous end joining protein LigD
VKRLAIRTEDHPIEYADFEDVIPPGQYGAGPVMVWDRGTYEPDDELSPEQQLARGEIKIVLHGIKLQGGFVLLYPGRSFSEPGEKTRWLLIKRRDEYADPSWQIDDPALDRSVLTGRTLKEIEENRPAKRLNAARVKHLAR